VAGSTMTGVLNLPANGLVAGTNQLVLSGGNVGIGTTAPADILDLKSSSTVDTGINLNNTSTSGRSFNIGSSGSGSTVGVGKFYIYDNTAAANRMVVDSAGNVGIGTVSPGAKLQVNGQAASVVATIASTTVDFNSGNIQTNSVAAGTLTLSNMIDGASYTLILTNATGGNYVLSGSSISAWHCAPACASNTVTVVGGTHTVLSLMKVGVNAYVTWINGM
jgi:hypothetical protein